MEVPRLARAADPLCIAAGATFAAAVLLWGWRNYSLFGDWATSPYMSAAYDWGLTQPALVAKALLGKGAFFGALLLVYAVPFAPELRASLRRLREAETSILWLFVLVIWALAWWVTSAFWPYEQGKSFFSSPPSALLIGVVLCVASVRAAEPVGRCRRRWAILAAILLALDTRSLLTRFVPLECARGEVVRPNLRVADRVIIKGSSHSNLDAHFSRIHRITSGTTPGERQPGLPFRATCRRSRCRGVRPGGHVRASGRSPSLPTGVAPVSITASVSSPERTEMYD